MSSYLVHITTGEDNPTKAALGFLVARTALEEGNDVAMFLAGDGVNLLKTATVETLVGNGTGALAEHVAAIKASTAEVFYSGMSAKARGLTPDLLAIEGAQPGMPSKLLSLASKADIVLCY